jgi:replicative DNA helicase
MAFDYTRLVCIHSNAYNSIYTYHSNGSDRGIDIAGTAGFFNTMQSTYKMLRVGDIIIAGVTPSSGCSAFVVTKVAINGGVSINGV